MAIQFSCPGCSQPIEVDDQFAGQTAACPYCRQVVSVPVQSTLHARPAVMAQPASMNPGFGAIRGLHVGAATTDPQARRGILFAQLALLSRLLGIVPFALGIFFMLSQNWDAVSKLSKAGPNV